MADLIDHYWMGLTAFGLATGLDRDTVRRKAERGEIEACLSERGYLLLAAKDVQKLRLKRAIARSREAYLRLYANATYNDGNGRPLGDYDEINRLINLRTLESLRAEFPDVSDSELVGAPGR
jgi:hypothetical protein